MKKILTLILVVVLTFSLFGCNGCTNPSAGSADHPTNATEPDAPSAEATEAPSAETTEAPTEESTEEPAEEPTEESTQAPTEESTEEPTEAPTEETTEAPTEEPSEAPTGHTHSYTSAITAPGCETGGQTTHTCACGDSYTTDQTAATGHKFGEWVTTEESTTMKHGTAERTCAACGKTESKQLDKLPIFHKHSYTAKVVAPTCTTEGYTVHTCACGDTYTDTPTAKTAHTYTKAVTNPTCTAEGYTTYTCSACGDSYMGDKTPKSAHSYTDTVTKPTCTAEGYTTHKCTKCGGTTVDTKVPATGHAYTESTTAPTCETDGYTTYTCATCGHSYQGNRQPAMGHVNTYVETMNPTCTENGWEKTICKDCGSQVGDTKTITANGSCSYETVLAHTAAERYRNYWGYPDYDEYVGFGGVICEQCQYCYDIDESSLRIKYSQSEIANTMLNYVNELRAQHGLNALQLSSSLMSLADTRSKEVSVNFAHTTGYCENITNAGGCGSNCVLGAFNQFYKSPGHLANMLREDMTTFGCDIYYSDGVAYCVQLFYW